MSSALRSACLGTAQEPIFSASHAHSGLTITLGSHDKRNALYSFLSLSLVGLNFP